MHPQRYSEDDLDWLENACRSPEEARRVDAAFWTGAVAGTVLAVAATLLIVRAWAAA